MNATASTTSDLQASDAKHHLHPFTDNKALGDKGARVIERAEGVYLWDSNGNKMLDGMSGLWCVNVGYGQKALADAAYKQMQELPYYNTFFQTSHPPAIELSRILAEVSPDHINRVFFTGSGSESNDTVVRMVRRYWDVLGHKDKHVIISRKNAYHGSTMAGASLGGMSAMHSQGGLPIPGIEHIMQPYWYQEGGALSPDEFGIMAASALEERINAIGADKVAAFIAEPIQGAGGVIVPPDTYWPEIQSICDKYGILLIADEVICGFGRTGEWFGSNYYNIKPDFMSIAKGLSSGYLPIGGVMISDRVAEVLIGQGGEFHHGYTYSGHPVACAVAIANLGIIRNEGLVDRVRDDIGPYLQNSLRTALSDHPLVGEVRGVGMLGAIELVKDKSTRQLFDEAENVGVRCREHCIANGLVMRAVDNSMITAPPLVTTRDQIDELVDSAKKAIDSTARDLGVM